MKILQINSVCGIASTGRIAVDLHNSYLSQGHESMIAFGRGQARGVAAEKVIRIGSNRNVYTHALMTRITDKTGFYSKSATRKFIESVKNYNPDVIHLHNIHGYYIDIELLFEYLIDSKKRVIWTLHDCWTFTGHCSNFDFCGCEKWRTQCEHCEQKEEYPASYFLDNSVYNYRKKKELFSALEDLTIVTPSKWLLSKVSESFLGKKRAVVINNGIDLDVFINRESSFREKHKLADKFVILGASINWSSRKGYDTFIRLAETVSNEFRLVLVGISKKVLKSLPKNIIGIERTNNAAELSMIYSAADVFVNPTLEDNFPTTNLEALACGTPVITYCTGGSAESIDETCGIAVSKNDFTGLMTAIQTAKENPYSKESCRRRSLLFDKSSKYIEYLTLYR